MFKLKFKKKTNPHKESLERALTANEQYLETMVAGTKEYELVNDAVQKQREALEAYDKPKFGFKEVIEVLGVIAGFAGAGATIYSTVHKDETRKEIATWIYQNEELDGKLGNGPIRNLATKE